MDRPSDTVHTALGDSKLNDLHNHASPASRWPVMVLAHNEEKRIASCLESVLSSDHSAKLDIYVMANGCTDATEAIVAEIASSNPAVHLVSIALGDKCNAWNVFVHDVVPAKCPGAALYFFMDGDARVTQGSLGAMARTLLQSSRANAVGAPPASGRNLVKDREELLRDRGLVANLYALKGSFISRCQTLGVRIPLRLEGDDGLVGALVKWDLDPRQAMDDDLIVACPDAGFTFDSFTPARLSDWHSYWKRMVRYGRRRYEFALLGPMLKRDGLVAMPADIRELYRDAANLELRWDGIYTLTNWFALREMRRIGSTMSTT